MNKTPLELIYIICRFGGCCIKINLSACTKYLYNSLNNQQLIKNMSFDVKLDENVFEKYHKYNDTKRITKLTKKIKKLLRNILITPDFIFHFDENKVIVNDDEKKITKYNYKNIKDVDYMDSHKLLIIELKFNKFIFINLITRKINKKKYSNKLTIQFYPGDDKYFKCINNKKESKTEIYMTDNIINTETLIFTNTHADIIFINNSWNDLLFITQYDNEYDDAPVVSGYQIKDSKLNESIYEQTNWCGCKETRFPHQYKMNYLYFSLYDPGYSCEATIFSLKNKEEEYECPFYNFIFGYHDFKIIDIKYNFKLIIQYNNEKEVIITDNYKDNSINYYKNIMWYEEVNDDNTVYMIDL